MMHGHEKSDPEIAIRTNAGGIHREKPANNAAPSGAPRYSATIGLVNFNAWVLGAGVLAIAGLFQFSRPKYHCLDQCRTPLSFIIQHWHGVTPRRDAFLLGMHHGVFCVGCCGRSCC